ncbi:MAG: hypothetical protein E4G98_06780 [Promethearchaeota archaeon]|nr:MAG: hypothetical protein E4G98_06780 [Candidatus Lokiarchaeota archaeon]
MIRSMKTQIHKFESDDNEASDDDMEDLDKDDFDKEDLENDDIDMDNSDKVGIDKRNSCDDSPGSTGSPCLTLTKNGIS